MNDDPAYAKGFSLSHQRVALEIDFQGRLTGSAFLTIYPNNPSLRCVNLHASPLLDIRAVTLSSPTEEDALLPTPASFSHTCPSQPLPQRPDQPMGANTHLEIKRKTWAAIGEQDEGELAVLVSNGWVRLLEKGDTVDFAPIQIQIDYTLHIGGELTEGIVFRREGDAGHDIPHMFLSPSTHQAARIWTPCIDSLWDRCTWELEFTVPRQLPNCEGLPPVTVVSSGELMEQIIHPHTPDKSIFYYLQASPTSVQHMMFAAGPFEMQVIHQEDKKVMLGFCLPGDADDMRQSTAFMAKAMPFFSKEFGVYPFSDYKSVFVSDPRVPNAMGATMSIFSSELLCGPDIVDQVYETRQIMSLAFAQQWIGINIIPRTLADTWVTNGLAIYIYAQFLRHLQGNNDYRFRLKRAIDKCARLDQGDKAPICVPGTTDLDIEFINLKAPLVLHILDRHLAKAGTSLGLSRVIPKIFLAALSDELPGNVISAHVFFRLCRKVSGLDLTPFADQWVYGSGCPKLRITTNFIRKKFLVELGVEQTQPATKSNKRPTPFFEGSLTVRIHEADGAPFEHLVDIKQPFKSFNLPFNTKYKRTKRSGRIAARFDHLRDQMAAEDEDSDAQLRDTDRTDVFAYPPWDNEAERTAWRVAEWSEEQADAMMSEGSGYEWIRIDPDCEWLAVFEFPEKPWYWISQLQGDKDVIAQLEAVQNLTAYSSYAVVASELARTVLVKNFYYKIRVEAAKALVHLDTPEAQYMGSFLLLKLLDHMRPQGRNDFKDIAEYLVLKSNQSVITAVSLLREPARAGERNVRMQPLAKAKAAILDILENNDNTDNIYSDGYYTATALAALGNMLDSNQDPRAMTAIEKAITFDRLIPSFGNVVTKAGLEAHLKAVMIGQQTNDVSLFLGYTREGNLRSLRITAFDSLLLCKPLGRSLALAKYLMAVITDDASLVIRRHVARALSESVLMALAFGDFINASSMIDTNVDEQARKDKTDKAIVKAIRQDYDRKPEFMALISKTLVENFATLDEEVRFALLKLAEMTTSSTPEPVPGHIIKLPTPVSETPPPIPKLKISIPDSQAASHVANGVSTGPVKLVIPGKKKVIPAQKKGLPDFDLKAITNALAKLNASQTSVYFRVPVDPVRDGAPDYLTHVRQPMDLQTVQAKLDNGLYATRQDFVQDVKLIVSNCLLYNGSKSEMGVAGKRFEKVFNNIWSKTEATLSSASAESSTSRHPTQPVSGNPTAPMRGPPAPAADVPAPEPPKPTLKFKTKVPSSLSTSHTPSSQTVPPMAPPPVPPPRKLSIPVPSKKRTRDADDMLAEEVDAMAAAKDNGKAPTASSTASTSHKHRMKDESGPSKKARRSPEKQVAAPQPKVVLSSQKQRDRERELQAYLDDSPPPAPAPAPLPPPSKSLPAAALPIAGSAVPAASPFANEDAPSLSGANIPFRAKRAKLLISTLQKDPSAVWFLRPVDPVADGCPTYLQEIKKPRDLGTIGKRVDGKEGKKYQTMQQLGEDIELVFANCRQFNPPGEITALADACESVYRREWPKAINPKMTPDERRAMASLLTRAIKDPLSWIFREAVDPVALNIPTYFDVIPPEDARDLSLIKSKLDKNVYSTYKQVDDDVSLMLENARMFNGEGEVTDAANAFGKWWDQQRKKMD